jgi:CRP/FNR family transcriptional regulator, cyclic AMP receptor protein
MVDHGDVARHTHAMSMERDVLRAWITGSPGCAEQLLKMVVRQLRATSKNFADLISTDVPGRVAKQLLWLAQRFGTREVDGWRVIHDLKQEEIGHSSAPHV